MPPPYMHLLLWRSAGACSRRRNESAGRLRQPARPEAALTALDAHGDAHAPADAKRGETFLGVAPLHLVQQRDENARAGCADRVADGDGAAIDVDLLGVPAKILVHRAGLRGEGLIGLDEFDIHHLPA